MWEKELKDEVFTLLVVSKGLAHHGEACVDEQFISWWGASRERRTLTYSLTLLLTTLPPLIPSRLQPMG